MADCMKNASEALHQLLVSGAISFSASVLLALARTAISIASAGRKQLLSL